MMMLIFVNKPLTAIFFVLGICLSFLPLLFDNSRFNICVPFPLSIAFGLFYCNSITLYYFLRGNEKFEVKGVDIRSFKGVLKAYWFISLIGFLIAIIILSYFKVIFGAVAFLFIYNFISFFVSREVLYSKFISLALKKNPTIKDFKIEDLYEDVREILLKKIIN